VTTDIAGSALVDPKKDSQAKLKALRKIIALKVKAIEPEQLDGFNKQLTSEMSPVLQGFTNEVQQLVEQSESLEALQQALVEFDLSVDEASEVMQRAFVASDLAGRFDVNSESGEGE
jgi:hypothetical protein